MAIAVKLLRTGSASTANTFVVTADTGDTGQLQIQYNSSDIYNNLSGASVDISSGASATTITVPLTSGEIPSGEYYFNFVASVGISDTATINFQVGSRNPEVPSDADIYAPSFRVDDDTNYTVGNGTVSAATRSLTVQYPATSLQPNLSAAAANTTTDLYVTTSNVWTGSTQTTLVYDVTYTIAATTGYDTFTYQETGTGYNSLTLDPDNSISDIYDCLESLRQQVDNAASRKRSNYADLLSNYTYALSLVTQFREAVVANKTAALDDILAEIRAITNCQGTSATNPSTQSTKIYGIGGSQESIQDIVATMFTTATNYGVTTTYNDTAGTLSLQATGLYLDVFNDTGSDIANGKSVYITGYDATSGLPEITLADSIVEVTSRSIGVTYGAIASGESGKLVINGIHDKFDTSTYDVGDKLYLASSGNISNTADVSSRLIQFVGTVVTVATVGKLAVAPKQEEKTNRALYMGVTQTAVASIPAQKAVYITGFGGSSGLPTVEVASNAASATSKAIGITLSDVASAGSGLICTAGEIRRIDMSAFTEGDILYLSTAGGFTATKPATSENSQKIGTVVEATLEGTLNVDIEEYRNIDSETIVNTVTVSAASCQNLNTTPIEIVSGVAASSINILGAQAVITSTPTPTPAGTLIIGLFRNTTDVFDATTVTNQTTFPTSAANTDVSDMPSRTAISHKLGEGVYLGTAADESAWDNGIEITVVYTITT